jgi:ABC-type Fe3+ transport system substrate-binding protein
LIDYATSEEGQQVLAENEYIPAMPSVPAKTPTVKPEAGGFKANVLSPNTVTENLERWMQIKKELFN